MSDDTSGFDIYPNPTASKDFILKFGSFLTGKECLLQINDFTGRALTQTKIIGQPILSVSIDSQAFKPGVYLVIIYFNYQKWVRKLVVL